jgi:DMSO/TMAO reductase YedYZ molybdopterin-dependent catalytic subunit
MHRRGLIVGAGAALTAGAVRAAERPRWMSPLLPDGTREVAVLEALPGKQKLIRLTDRPPNYETPIEAFRTAVTPNEDFFVRYHLAAIPPMDALGNWSLNVGGEAAERQTTFSLDDLQKNFEQLEVVAVCQCSGNRRGLSSPHVAGVEWGYGAMGGAAWSGPRLKDVLANVGVKADAVEVWLDGADGPVLPTTPDFRKSLPLDKALSDEVIIATSMNGAKLPHLNGYPARIVVPGWTATYWMKHVNSIQLSTKPLNNFWMQKAYRVPAGMFKVDQPFPTQDTEANWPITDMVVNSVVAGPIEGTRLTANGFTVQGVAWDRGHGIRQVEVSLDGGKTWQEASLRKDLGRFAFRGFTFATGRLTLGDYVISSRATSNAGETQVEELKFNPAGYHNNVPQQIAVTVA